MGSRLFYRVLYDLCSAPKRLGSLLRYVALRIIEDIAAGRLAGLTYITACHIAASHMTRCDDDQEHVPQGYGNSETKQTVLTLTTKKNIHILHCK
jgi:hypothetical protein